MKRDKIIILYFCIIPTRLPLVMTRACIVTCVLCRSQRVPFTGTKSKKNQAEETPESFDHSAFVSPPTKRTGRQHIVEGQSLKKEKNKHLGTPAYVSYL